MQFDCETELSSRVNSGQGKEARFSVYFASGNHPYFTLSFCSLNATDLFPSSMGEHEPQERLIDIFRLFGHCDCIMGWNTTKVRPGNERKTGVKEQFRFGGNKIKKKVYVWVDY